jgi:hypothetical protein
MSLRDANVVIIETSRTVVRAGLGLFDLLKTPSIVCCIVIPVSVQANVDFPYRKYPHALDCEEARQEIPSHPHEMEASLML